MPTVKDEWESIHSQRAWGRYPVTEYMNFIANLEFSRPYNEVRFLDAGCGNGAVMWHLLRMGIDAYGIDISESAIKRTKAFLEEEGFPNPNVIVGDLKAIPCPNESFDIVADVCTFQCNPTEDLPQILSEIARVLRRGGMLFSMYRAKGSRPLDDAASTFPLAKEEYLEYLTPNFTEILMDVSARTFDNMKWSMIHHLVIAKRK